MQLFTRGHVNVTPFKMAYAGSLRDIVAQLLTRNYNVDRAPTAGWGGPTRLREERGIPVDLLDSGEATDAQLRRNPGSPEVVRIRGRQALHARLYVDVINRTLQRLLSGRDLVINPEAYHTVEVVDLFLVDDDDGFTGLLSTQDESLIDQVLSELSLSLEGNGGGPRISLLHPGLSPESDLFLWLLGKMQPTEAGVLATDLRLVAIRQLWARDRLERKVNYMDRPDLDRLELLVRIDEEAVFGPAKIVLADETLNLEADIQLKENGQFDIHVGSCLYGARTVTLGPERLQLAYDISRIVLPKLLRAHGQDTKWHDAGRAAFLRDCREEVRRRVNVGQP